MRLWATACALAAVSCADPTPAELEADAADCPAQELRPLSSAGGHLVALNAYYLQEEATRALRRGDSEAAFVEETLAKAAALGAGAVRTNAFNDDPAKAGDSAIQIGRLEYDEVGLRGLDLVLTRAAAQGVKLVLPLANHWNDYGGARQYVAWAGLDQPAEGDPRFYREPAVIEHFKEHLRRLLSRINSFDGIRYGEHPAVLAWELANEPRGPRLDAEGAQMRNWVDQIAALVKSLAPGHLVGTGEEGLDADHAGYDMAFWDETAPAWLFGAGSSFRRNTASLSIDYGSVHLYPEKWQFQRGRVGAAGARWIHEHTAIARALGKPLMVAEFALPNRGAFTLAERRALYRGWFRCARATGAAGAAPWLFAYDGRPDAWDAHTFYFRDGTRPEDPANRYADLVLEATR